MTNLYGKSNQKILHQESQKLWGEAFRVPRTKLYAISRTNVIGHKDCVRLDRMAWVITSNHANSNAVSVLCN